MADEKRELDILLAQAIRCLVYDRKLSAKVVVEDIDALLAKPSPRHLEDSPPIEATDVHAEPWCAVYVHADGRLSCGIWTKGPMDGPEVFGHFYRTATEGPKFVRKVT